MNSFQAKWIRLFEAGNFKSDSALARFLGISPSSVNGAKARELIPGNWIEKIAAEFEINANWLLFGSEPKLLNEITLQSPSNESQVITIELLKKEIEFLKRERETMQLVITTQKETIAVMKEALALNDSSNNTSHDNFSPSNKTKLKHPLPPYSGD